MRVSSVASAIFSGDPVKPGARSGNQPGMKIMASAQNRIIQVNSTDSMSRRRQRQPPCRHLPLARKLRHKGIVESALGKQGPEQVGQALRHKEGFSHKTRAHREGNQLVAHEAQKAADQREAPTLAADLSSDMVAPYAALASGASTCMSACVMRLCRVSLSIFAP